MIKETVKNIKKKLFCQKGKHKWEYCTWGSAPVDNLNGTFGLWSIGTRSCDTCDKTEYRLKNGFELAKKKLTIRDFGYEKLDDIPE